MREGISELAKFIYSHAQRFVRERVEFKRTPKELVGLIEKIAGTKVLKAKWNPLLLSRVLSQVLHAGLEHRPKRNHLAATEDLWKQFVYYIHHGIKFHLDVFEMESRPSALSRLRPKGEL